MSTSLAAAVTRPPEASIRVLLVDDDDVLARGLARALSTHGFAVTTALSGEAALHEVEREEFDVVLVDVLMPGMSGIETLRRIREGHSDLAVLMMSGAAAAEMADECVHEGAYQLISKPFASNDALALTVRQAGEHKRLMTLTRTLEQKLESGELVGTSPAMQNVIRLIEGVATTTSTILITGESGTGKELVATAIHRRSPRASKPLVAVNCAAIPAELVESELFGHTRGAFTGAQGTRAGLFEAAHNGTIFLDEIGDLPLPAQVKLLRTLQQGEIKPVGSDQTRTVDVRVVAATNVDLPAKVKAGEFRRDLFYRINVIPIRLPPLRERGDDIVILAQRFLRKLALRMGRPEKRLAPDAIVALKSYSWPGNVRELEHTMEREFVLSRGSIIHASDLPIERDGSSAAPRVSSSTAPPGAVAKFSRELMALQYPEARRRLLAEFEASYVRASLDSSGGSVSEAARKSGIDRSNFRRIARRARID